MLFHDLPGSFDFIAPDEQSGVPGHGFQQQPS